MSQLPPQTRDQGIHTSRVDIGIAIADDLDQIVATQGAAIAFDESCKQVELASRQANGVAIDRRELTPQKIHDEGAKGGRGAAPGHVPLDLAAPQQGAGSGEKVTQVDGLVDIVVTGKLEADDPIDVGIATRHEDDSSVGNRLKLLCQLEPVSIRQDDVDEDQF